MKLALIPINVTIGDFEGNLKKTLVHLEAAVKNGASLVVFPELSLIGYPPQDLLLRPSFAKKCEEQLTELHQVIQKKYPKLAVIVGTALELEGHLANCAVFLQGERREVRPKTLIPFYDVFHESRYFTSAKFFSKEYQGPVRFLDGTSCGILVCEDSWHDMELYGSKIYSQNPTADLVKQGCDFLVNISASPFEKGKRERRRSTMISAAKKHGLPFFYVNHFGAQDEILFDGEAFAISKNGEFTAIKPDFNGEALYASSDESKSKLVVALAEQNLADLHAALVTGLRDYAGKNGFKRFVLGLSGGIDSALVATLACDAVGAENVLGLTMPSKFSSSHSLEDAEQLARNLGMATRNFPIKFLQSTFLMALKPFFEGTSEDLTEENLQSRLRGISVMAFSNKFGHLALATGNKSEFAVGYSTLYGDSCGALAPIGDLYKTEVYKLAHYLNERRARIPERSITKAPSAELRPNQTDQDSLPPYDLLDAVLYHLIEEEQEVDSAYADVKKLFPSLNKKTVDDVSRSIRIMEYKRRQTPPILRVSKKAFGMGRRYPITGRY